MIALVVLIIRVLLPRFLGRLSNRDVETHIKMTKNPNLRGKEEVVTGVKVTKRGG